MLPVGTYPATKWVRQTNRAVLSVAVINAPPGDRDEAIDNLLEGQAGQAVQCLNVMAGLPQQTGAAAALLSLSRWLSRLSPFRSQRLAAVDAQRMDAC